MVPNITFFIMLFTITLLLLNIIFRVIRTNYIWFLSPVIIEYNTNIMYEYV